MKNRKADMLSGSITKGLLAMSIPIMIMNVMQSFFNIIDMTVLKYFSSESAVGAVGACGTLISLFTSLLIGLSAGSNVVVAKHIGAADSQRADNAVMTAILLSLSCGCILMVIGVTFAETFLKMTNCPGGLLPRATQYFRIYFFGIPALMLYNFCAAILRAIGDTQRPMYFLLIGGIIKVVLTVMFVTTLDMSVEGSALATVCSHIITSILAFFALLKHKNVIHIDFKKIKFHLAELKAILYIGIPSGLQSALYSLANVVITAAVNTFGEDATTGISIANQFDGILYQISYAPSLATIPYVAQNIGAGKLKRVKQIAIRAVLITAAFGMTFGSLSAVFSEQLSSIMASSPTVIGFSKQKMVIISSTYFICGINEVLGGVFKGMGKPILPTATTLIFMCLLRFVWVYAVFPYYPNLSFLYLVWPIGWILSIITLLIFYFPTISAMQKKYLRTGSDTI